MLQNFIDKAFRHCNLQCSVISGQALCLALNQLLKPAREAGDFDFLRDRCVAIGLSDFNLSIALTLTHGRFTICQPSLAAASICAASGDLLRIAAGLDDPDTLFFQRRLQITGDTELGLQLKNTLDSVELARIHPRFRQGLTRLVRLITRPRQLATTPWN